MPELSETQLLINVIKKLLETFEKVEEIADEVMEHDDSYENMAGKYALRMGRIKTVIIHDLEKLSKEEVDMVNKKIDEELDKIAEEIGVEQMEALQNQDPSCRHTPPQGPQ